jgi:hypothetical protein
MCYRLLPRWRNGKPRWTNDSLPGDSGGGSRSGTSTCAKEQSITREFMMAVLLFLPSPPLI